MHWKRLHVIVHSYSTYRKHLQFLLVSFHESKERKKIDFMPVIIIISAAIAAIFAIGFIIFIIDDIITIANFQVAEAADGVTVNDVQGLAKMRDNLTGIVTRIVDGDTLDVHINRIITGVRFALVNTPERGEAGYKEAKDFLEDRCPVGSTVLVDSDNGQNLSFDRIVGVVYCYDATDDANTDNRDDNDRMINLSDALLDHDLAKPVTKYCDTSEFSHREWIKDQCNGGNPLSSSSFNITTD
jgi:endonuclease YncB( thermonuclease family)